VDAGAPDIRATRSGFRPVSLDAVNFLSADVRGAVGPYLNVFLVTQQHWSQSEVGLVTMIGGLGGLAVQTPIGAAIDETRAKRGVVVLALAVLAVKVGARIVHHGRAITFQMAKVMVPRGLLRKILSAIGALGPLPPVRCWPPRHHWDDRPSLEDMCPDAAFWGGMSANMAAIGGAGAWVRRPCGLFVDPGVVACLDRRLGCL
jgi:hypothetical protein